MQYDPKDSKQHIKHDSMTLARGATTWRVMGVSDEKALRLRDEQEGAGTWARLQSGKWSELWTRGLKHSHVHLLQRKQVYLSAYLGCALVVGGVPKSHGESEARDALWEIKGRNKAAS